MTKNKKIALILFLPLVIFIATAVLILLLKKFNYGILFEPECPPSLLLLGQASCASVSIVASGLYRNLLFVKIISFFAAVPCTIIGIFKFLKKPKL